MRIYISGLEISKMSLQDDQKCSTNSSDLICISFVCGVLFVTNKNKALLFLSDLFLYAAQIQKALPEPEGSL